MGIYDTIVTTLKPLPPADASYQDKVDKIKEAIHARDGLSLASAYARLRTGSGRTPSASEVEALIHDFGKDGLAKIAYQINLRIEAYEQLLDASQDEQAPGWGTHGVKDNAVRLPSGDTVRVNREPYGKVMDKEQFRLWCIANGYESQLQLWPSTMNAIVKERLKEGEPPPDGTEAFSYVKVSLVPAKDQS